jgi:peptidoglycan/xylan/chitin deacetylase (PgdA/CDA1 family)
MDSNMAPDSAKLDARNGQRAACRADDFPAESPAWRGALKGLGMRTAGQIAIGLGRMFGSRSRGRAGILTYHRVMPPPVGMAEPPDNVTPDRFRAHVAGLLQRGFNIRSLRELLSFHAQGKSLPPQTAALTFDDGYESVLNHAWPVLREFQVPATVFLATAYLGSAQPFPFDPWGMAHATVDAAAAAYRPLTLDQCHEMAAGGLMDFGAHTHTHRDLRNRPEQFREDVRTSAEFIRAEFDEREVMFAFPYGSPWRGFAGAALVAAAKQAGVVCGLTTECDLLEPGSDPFQWGRFNAFPWDTDATLAAKLGGWYTWAAHGKRAVMRCFHPTARATSRPIAHATSN